METKTQEKITPTPVETALNPFEGLALSVNSAVTASERLVRDNHNSSDYSILMIALGAIQTWTVKASQIYNKDVRDMIRALDMALEILEKFVQGEDEDHPGQLHELVEAGDTLLVKASRLVDLMKHKYGAV